MKLFLKDMEERDFQMDKKIVYDAINNSGWKIECESPLEVSYEENFAKHMFAEIVIESRIKEILDAVISVKIDQWHKRDNEDVKLHDHLNISWEEYKTYTHNNIVPKRLEEDYLNLFNKKPVQYLDYL